MLGFEVFGDDVYLFLGLSWERRGRRGFVDRGWNRLGGFLLRITIRNGDAWCKLQGDF